MTRLEQMIESCKDKDGIINMDTLIAKYSSPKSNMILNMLTRHIIENKLSFTVTDWHGGNHFEKIPINPK